jgi:hypothetical protein
VIDERRSPAVALPRRDDPRLKVALVVTALQVLGQTGLGFKLTITQIVVPIAICALGDVSWTYVERREVVWPASGLVAGNSIAFILRASGTKHGAWWTTHGLVYFVAAAVVAVVSKYALHRVFNPSNLGIVAVLGVVGVTHVFPQYLWWGPPGWGLVIAWLVIVAGGIWLLRQLGMFPMVAAFIATLWAAIGALAITGHGFFARWSDARLSGSDYWTAICLSPEVIVFACFMITDPRTAPKTPRRRLLYGAGVASVAAALCSVQTTEFGIKLSILASLTIVCAVMALSRARRTKLVALSIAVAAASMTVRAAYDPGVLHVEHPPGASSGVASQ